VVPHIVRDVSPAEEGRLDDIDEVVQGALQPVGQDKHHQLHITIEERDGAVPCQLIRRLSGLGEEADDAAKKRAERGCVLIASIILLGSQEGCIEDAPEGGGQLVLEGPVELIGEPVPPGAGVATRGCQGVLHILRRE